MPHCAEAAPAFVQIAPGHYVACYLYDAPPAPAAASA
jgi:hypothetical protein